MSGQDTTHGFIYRIARATGEQLHDYIRTYVGTSVTTFGGAAQWDFDPHSKENLRPIIKTDKDVEIHGDFGHAFSEQAEVRWKRLDEDEYDVLILGESLPIIPGAVPLCPYEPGANWEVRKPGPGLGLLQTSGRGTIRYFDYLAPNGTVQFQRLVSMKEARG